METTGSEPALGWTNNKKHQEFSALSFVTFWNLKVMLNCEISIPHANEQCQWWNKWCCHETDLGSEVPLAERKKEKEKKGGGVGGGRTSGEAVLK